MSDLAGRTPAHSSREMRRYPWHVRDSGQLLSGLVALTHLLGEHLARSNDTTIKTVLTGLGEHVDLESARRS